MSVVSPVLSGCLKKSELQGLYISFIWLLYTLVIGINNIISIFKNYLLTDSPVSFLGRPLPLEELVPFPVLVCLVFI